MYQIDQNVCTFCAGCSAVCPEEAITIHDDKSTITELCRDCKICELFCPVSAIDKSRDNKTEE